MNKSSLLIKGLLGDKTCIYELRFVADFEGDAFVHEVFILKFEPVYNRLH